MAMVPQKTGCKGEYPCKHALYPFNRHCAEMVCDNYVNKCSTHSIAGGPMPPVKELTLRGKSTHEKFFRVKYRYKDTTLIKTAHGDGPVRWWTWTETTDEKQAIEVRDEINAGAAFLAIITTVERRLVETEYSYPLGGTYEEVDQGTS